MPKLLVSHATTDDTSERAALVQLCDALGAEGYDIMLDQRALIAGADWRETIDNWIRTCDGALVLVTPGAIASASCQYEWSALAFRRRMQKRFPLIPIYLGSRPEDIRGRPDGLHEIGGYFGFAAIADIIPDLKRRLAEPA